MPYERHFLLLCVCTSVFVKIRCYADLIFSRYESDWDKIKIFSTPKVLRFAEILEQFQPPDQNGKNTHKDIIKGPSEVKVCSENSQHIENNRNSDENGLAMNENSQVNHETGNMICENAVNDVIDYANENIGNDQNNDSNTEDTISKTNKMLEAIEKCDFISLSNKIEDRVHIIESNLKEINLNEECNENKKNNENKHINHSENKRNENIVNDSQNKTNEITINDSEKKVNDNENRVNDKGMFPRRTGHRTRGRGRVQRSNAARAQQLQQNPDALCGIVFMKEALMAKIMFMLIVVSKFKFKILYFVGKLLKSSN